MKTLPPLAAACIGSVPFTDVEWTLDLLGQVCPEIPCWPQMSQVSRREDMVLQAVDGLPLLEADTENSRVRVLTEGKEEALTLFYEHFLSGDYDYFAVPPEAGCGLQPFLARASADPTFGPDYLKAQIIGPVSFGQSVRTGEDKTLLDDPDLCDTVVKGLGAKAAWLARRIREVGRTPVVFIDEPGLTGYGSGFSTLQADRVKAMIDEAASIPRAEGEVFIGTHVCGNTDWGLLTETSIDIINFDAYGFLDHFLLYPKQVERFFRRGGMVAWGIVPTREYTGQTADELAGKLLAGWDNLAKRGLDLETIRERTIITPSCGTGALHPDTALAVLELLPQVRERLIAG